MMDSDSLKALALKYALKNAKDYGKASANAVLGKMLAENPEAKNSIAEARNAVEHACATVNGMSGEKIAKELAGYKFAELEKKDGDNIVLPGADELKASGGKILTRFPPEPNGYPHIGHAKAAFLGFASAKKYGGDFLIRFDDTNPEKEKEEYVKAILEDLEWLGIKPDVLDFASDHMQKLYDYAENMIENNMAYVCTCDLENIRKMRERKEECACRSNTVQKNSELWNAMLGGTIQKGKAVLRLRGDMQSNNTVMRDPLLARIIDAPHYRQGTRFRVWPTYDLQAPVMDWLNGVTHAIRSKEYELRDESYRFVLECMGNKAPTVVSISRLAIEGYPISKRLLQPLVLEGKVLGWDDPRLPTIRALRRRGILPEAIRNVVLQFGFSKVESVIKMDRFYNENSKLLNPIAKRLFFVPEPVKLIVKGKLPEKVSLRLHPTENLGERKVATENKLWISGTDKELAESGKEFRLKDLANVKVVGREGNALLAEVVQSKTLPEKKIQWVLASGAVEAMVLDGQAPFKGEQFQENSLKEIHGLAEGFALTLDIGQIIQFERFGYCRLDRVEKGQDGKARLEFVFCHK